MRVKKIKILMIDPSTVLLDKYKEIIYKEFSGQEIDIIKCKTADEFLSNGYKSDFYNLSFVDWKIHKSSDLLKEIRSKNIYITTNSCEIDAPRYAIRNHMSIMYKSQNQKKFQTAIIKLRENG